MQARFVGKKLGAHWYAVDTRDDRIVSEPYASVIFADAEAARRNRWTTLRVHILGKLDEELAIQSEHDGTEGLVPNLAMLTEQFAAVVVNDFRGRPRELALLGLAAMAIRLLEHIEVTR